LTLFSLYFFRFFSVLTAVNCGFHDKKEFKQL
jgi:hypothetical protein